MNTLTDELRLELKKFLQHHSEIVATWEGGSAATGYLDQYSDLDLSIVINKGNPDNIFSLLDEFLEINYGIIKRFRMPEPTWHGMSQCFYQLKNFPPLFYCDIVVVMADNPQKLTEQDRHGKTVIWFDKGNIYNGSETSQADREKLFNQYYHIATDFDWLSIIELKKALARKNWLAAQRCYLQFINRHLVSLLNIRYRPERADFGMRYVERDYPIEIIKRLEDFIKISSVEDIEERLPSVLEMFEDLKVQL